MSLRIIFSTRIRADCSFPALQINVSSASRRLGGQIVEDGGRTMRKLVESYLEELCHFPSLLFRFGRVLLLDHA